MKKQTGFTLLELMVTFIVFGTVLVVAIPSFQALLERKSIESIAPLFERSIKLARTEAIQRNVTVRILPKELGDDWSLGWSIEYTDADNAIVTIRHFDPLPGSPVFSSDDFDTNNPIQIRPSGQAFEIGTLSLYYPGCIGKQMFSFQLLISGILKKDHVECPASP